jgi:hypothetical protein
VFAPFVSLKDSMRRLAALLLPVLALSACVGPAYGPRGGGGRYDQRASERWYDREDLPLAARITPRGNSDFTVDLNRPAYVAVFEILPGQGVGLLYPRYEREDAYFPAGFSPLDLTGTSRDYNWYSSSLSGRYSRSEPRAYFLVASRRPLRISRFQRGGGDALRSVLGLSTYGAVNYQSVMNDLVGAIVPNQAEEDWTTDVYTVWPSRGDRYYYAEYPQQYVQVYCGDGTYDVVPVELARFACGRGRGGIVHRGGYDGGYSGGNGGNVPPPRGRDTTQVTAPGRRRPEPLTGAGETSGASGTRRPRPLGRPETAEPTVPREGGGDGPRVAPVEGPRREPRAAPRAEPRPEPRREEPRVEPRPEPRRETPRRETPGEPGEPQERPRSEPVYQAPRAEPAAPREAPRAEPVYQAPREAPRAEPVYQAPREAPRSEPVYQAPREAPRSEPVYSAPPPSPPPAPPSEPTPRVSSPVEPAAQR